MLKHMGKTFEGLKCDPRVRDPPDRDIFIHQKRFILGPPGGPLRNSPPKMGTGDQILENPPLGLGAGTPRVQPRKFPTRMNWKINPPF